MGKFQGKDFWDGRIHLSTTAQQLHCKNALVNPFENNPLDISIFISCYNEEDFIIDTLDIVIEAMTVVGKTFELIVIDDCSKDNSAALVKQYISDHPEVNILLRENKKNKGLAQNYIDGAFLGRGKYYRLICGDNAEPLETIVKVFSLIGQADIIVPYYISAEGKSSYRQWISKTYTWLINLISGNKINYYNGLQVHLRHNIMRWHPNTHGFGFQADILCILLGLGFTYIEVPCVTIEKRGGKGNALTWKNLISVKRTAMSILLRRIVPWT